jgi:hypothetical protein
MALLGGDWVAHDDFLLLPVSDQDETMAAIDEATAVAAVVSKVEALRRDAVRRVQDGFEHDPLVSVMEDAKQWRLPVVGAEAGQETGVADEAPPAPADGGGAREVGWQRRETEEDLPHHIVVVGQGDGRHGRGAATAAAAGYSGALLTRVDLGMAADLLRALLQRRCWQDLELRTRFSQDESMEMYLE